MSVRQDNENKNCPSRGLGIAAAAIGVGVGAALYYLFSKREDPDSSGATSSWSCEREHALPSSDGSFSTISENTTSDTSMNLTLNSSNDNNESFNSTSDNEASFTSTSQSFNRTSDNGTSFDGTSQSFTSTSDNDTSFTSTTDTETSFTSTSDSSNESSETDDPNNALVDPMQSPSLSYIARVLSSDTSFETGYMTLHINSDRRKQSTKFVLRSDRVPFVSTLRDWFKSDLDHSLSQLLKYKPEIPPASSVPSFTRVNSIDSDINMEWDVTNSSLDVPNDVRRTVSRGVRGILNTILDLGATPRVTRRRINCIKLQRTTLKKALKTEEDQMAILREQAFRERSWSPEECSICFDMMTQTQEVMALPCTHRFHQACILPWLQERQTCPNCRKIA